MLLDDTGQKLSSLNNMKDVIYTEKTESRVEWQMCPLWLPPGIWKISVILQGYVFCKFWTDI